jgi:RecJ-like exonuclease
MKKYFILIATMLLFFTFSNAQNYPKCNVCYGNKTVFKKSGVKQECNNCKDWAASYKKKVPCDICKDTRYIFGSGYVYCNECQGTGKGIEQRNKEYAEAVKFFEEEEAERNISLQRPHLVLFCWRSRDE